MAALSFGVELEAVFFYPTRGEDVIFDDDLPPLPDINDKTVRQRNPGIPSDDDVLRTDMDADMMRLVLLAIDDCVSKLPQSSRGTLVPFPDDAELNEYRRWQVEEERIPLVYKHYPEWTYITPVGLEVKSPAMYATESAFREVEAVTNMIRTTFRTAVPPGCGFHVHVGLGPNPFPVCTLKRLATVCWAGDLILQHMHPVARRYNDYCVGPRAASLLSRGYEAGHFEPCGGWRDSPVQFDPSDIPVLEDHTAIQEHINTGRPRRLPSNFTRTLPRGMFEDTPSEEERKWCEGYTDIEFGHSRFAARSDADILQGAAELLRCQTAHAVQQLMGFGRGAYNFEHYQEYGDILLRRISSKRTVEFRQAAGSLNGDWVSTYARICVGMVRFAHTAPIGDLWRVVYDCHCEETYNTQYDVLDLLLDLGLCEEAKTVQYRLETGEYNAEMMNAFSPKSFRSLHDAHLHPLTLPPLTRPRARRAIQRRSKRWAIIKLRKRLRSRRDPCPC
ncbi:hypothetical protein GGS26DRAFT_536397 [Hypomontagnella submonticulosa]|nr:hypothetical protein GGS26DRAFT_536397 [Hypomontagnella submonticulosa]